MLISVTRQIDNFVPVIFVGDERALMFVVISKEQYVMYVQQQHR